MQNIHTPLNDIKINLTKLRAAGFRPDSRAGQPSVGPEEEQSSANDAEGQVHDEGDVEVWPQIIARRGPLPLFRVPGEISRFFFQSCDQQLIKTCFYNQQLFVNTKTADLPVVDTPPPSISRSTPGEASQE